MLEILNKLGVDETIFFQIFLWLIAFFITKKILLDTLVERVIKRKSLTVGSEEELNKILAQANKKESLYSDKAKELNNEIKKIFSDSLKKATSDSTKKIAVAKKQAQESLNQTKQEILNKKKRIKAELDDQVLEVASLIKEKVI